MNNPYIIASYPRSGSTWLRFILANLMYPDKNHDFNSVHEIIPALDHETELRNGIENPRFYKTHSLRNGTNVVFLYRDVRDVLVSEFWYKKKYDDKDDRTFLEFLIADDFGANWRRAIDHYFPSTWMLSYEILKKGDATEILSKLPLPDFTPEQFATAMEKSSFDKLQEVEKTGFGIHPAGNKDIKFFREGKSGNLASYGEEIVKTVEKKNFFQLKQLGYL